MPKKNEDPKGELPPIWTDTQDEPKDQPKEEDDQ
jgi:hypothetical protein